MKNNRDRFIGTDGSAFRYLLDIAKTVRPSLDDGLLYQDYYGENRLLSGLYERWKISVANGKPDFSVYADDAYITESFNCWRHCSRRSISAVNRIVSENPNFFEDIKCVLDLGCGCAYTTAGLSNIFPLAEIVGTNLRNTLSYDIDEQVCARFDRCRMIDESQSCALSRVDIVVGLEFFEHLLQPLDFITQLIQSYYPRVIIIANSFTCMSLGHFDKYLDMCGNAVDGPTMSKMFYALLRNNGYKKLQTGVFGDRPRVYVRNVSVNRLF